MWLKDMVDNGHKIQSSRRMPYLAQKTSVMNSLCLFWKKLTFRRENGVVGHGKPRSLEV